MGKIKVRKYLVDELRRQYEVGHGVSRFKVKDTTTNHSDLIHSHNTWQTYTAQARHFADWCKSRGITDPDEGRQNVPEYIQTLLDDGKSIATVKTALAALSHGYKCRMTDWDVKIPTMTRSQIKRSRFPAVRDRNFSEANNRLLITFGDCSGLRRSELEALHGDDLLIADSGQVYLHVESGKGGKSRDVALYGSPDEIEAIVSACQTAGRALVWPRVHSAYDEHSHRAVYACRLYREMARPIEQLPPSRRYVCRKDFRGKIYDKDALSYISHKLGHNRLNVIVDHYLYNL